MDALTAIAVESSILKPVITTELKLCYLHLLMECDVVDCQAELEVIEAAKMY